MVGMPGGSTPGWTCVLGKRYNPTWRFPPGSRPKKPTTFICLRTRSIFPFWSSGKSIISGHIFCRGQESEWKTRRWAHYAHLSTASSPSPFLTSQGPVLVEPEIDFYNPRSKRAEAHRRTSAQAHERTQACPMSPFYVSQLALTPRTRAGCNGEWRRLPLNLAKDCCKLPISLVFPGDWSKWCVCVCLCVWCAFGRFSRGVKHRSPFISMREGHDT